MAYQIKLEVFEGPFDLLFHLIEKNEVDIYDIPIAKITEQYIEYIENMQMLDLEVASEFLVMAANLLSIKARMLLPKPPPEETEEELAADCDPRNELVEKLLDYKKYKLAAGFLKEQEAAMGKVFTRPNEQEMFAHLFREENPVEGICLDSVLEALQEVLQRAVNREFVGEIPRDKVSTRQKMKEIISRLQSARQGISFGELFRPGALKIEIVVTFLALLELIRIGRVRAFQSRHFGEIMLYGKEQEAAEA